MSRDTDQVDDSEYLYRAVPNVPDYISYENGSLKNLGKAACKAFSNDSDGLSFFRANFVEPQKITELLTNENGYYIFKIKASDIRKLGLSLNPTPNLSDLPGHVSLPEINTNNQNKSKRGELVKLLKENAKIVLTPMDYKKDSNNS